jgi:hypothetical protein
MKLIVRKIVLREPIKRFGSYTVPMRLHRDVTVDIPVTVLGEVAWKWMLRLWKHKRLTSEQPEAAASEASE